MGVRRVPVVKPDRLYALKLLLERGQCVPMSDILQRLEISRATAKRDLEFLRDRMGVPVQWDAFSRGYCIRSETRRPESAPRELPGLWFTDQEVAALLTMYELVAEADDTGHVRRDLLPLKRRLQKMLGKSRSEVKALLERVRDVAQMGAFAQEQISPRCRAARPLPGQVVLAAVASD